MKKLFFAITIGVLQLFLASIGQSQTNAGIENRVSLENTEQFSISSSYVKEETYLIQIGLPFNYHSSKESYPVLYVLDGDRAFGIAKGIADWLRIGNEIKDIIVVGISYGQGISDSKMYRDGISIIPKQTKPPLKVMQQVQKWRQLATS
jgi:enterochelin esterase-like enzyme